MMEKRVKKKLKKNISEAEFEASYREIQSKAKKNKNSYVHEMDSESMNSNITDADKTDSNKMDVQEHASNDTNTNNTNILKPTFDTTKPNINTNTDINLHRKENLYNEHDIGHIFKVILEKELINEIQIGQLLQKLNFKSINLIKKTSRNRVVVSFADKYEANKIISNVSIKVLHNIKAYIPNSFIKCVGIVRDVPVDLSEDELAESCRVQGGTQIDKIERMTYWDSINKCAKPSRNIKIEFRSTNLPENMIVFYVKKNIEPFIPKPTICKKCLRYGHVAKICRSTETNCINCSEVTHALDINCSCAHCKNKCITKCKYCQVGDHNSTQVKCPEYIKQTEIKKIMYTENLSFMEAKNKVVSNNTNPKKSYADITSLSNKIDALSLDLEVLRNFNKELMQRNKEAEKIMEQITNIISQNIETNNLTNNNLHIDGDDTIETNDMTTLVSKNTAKNLLKDIETFKKYKLNINKTDTFNTNNKIHINANSSQSCSSHGPSNNI